MTVEVGFNFSHLVEFKRLKLLQDSLNSWLQINYILICFGLFFLVVFFLLGVSAACEFFSADILEHSVYSISEVVWTRSHDLWLTECSETSTDKIQTPGNHPKERIQHSQHGASLKSRIIFFFVPFVDGGFSFENLWGWSNRKNASFFKIILLLNVNWHHGSHAETFLISLFYGND